MARRSQLGERVMELGEVAKERGLGEGAPDEGVHRLPEWGTPGSGAPGELAKGRGCKSPVTKE